MEALKSVALRLLFLCDLDHQPWVLLRQARRGFLGYSECTCVISELLWKGGDLSVIDFNIQTGAQLSSERLHPKPMGRDAETHSKILGGTRGVLWKSLGMDWGIWRGQGHHGKTYIANWSLPVGAHRNWTTSQRAYMDLGPIHVCSRCSVGSPYGYPNIWNENYLWLRLCCLPLNLFPLAGLPCLASVDWMCLVLRVLMCHGRLVWGSLPSLRRREGCMKGGVRVGLGGKKGGRLGSGYKMSK